ncbi:LOW QUALITY PROTEIN: uncharacterized protein [Procambarus clarkii]|uniref:LOW QUALITY PROTEIN: uncharacterized protein n=1 Tax=Procambarus clarkii TaxID=6728 RepID=UPI0037449C57
MSTNGCPGQRRSLWWRPIVFTVWLTLHIGHVLDMKEERVLVLQKSGTPSPESYVRLVTPFPRLDSFTICYRIRLVRFREESTLMSYAFSIDRDNEFRIDHREEEYKVSIQEYWAATKLVTPLRSWTHFCFSYQMENASWTIYLNGERRDEGTFPAHTSSLQTGGAFVIGQEQDTVGGGFQRDQSFCGEITHLNIWGEVLHPLTIQQVAACEEGRPGDLLSWATSSELWQVNGEATWEMRSRVDLCRPTGRFLTVFPDPVTLDQAKRLCQVAGGRVLVPSNPQENSWVYQRTQNMFSHCSGGMGANFLWLGASDAVHEGLWTYLDTTLAIPWAGPWRGDGPNGGTQENCLVMLNGEFPAQWSDITCLDSYSFCVPCEFNQLETIYLKGPAVCPNSPFNYQYVLVDERGTSRPSLAGFYHSDIFWQNSSWFLQSLKAGEVSAWWTPGKDGMYPFGTRPWTLGAEVCGMNPGTVVNLTLSVCKEGEFTCADGSCIDLAKRCDLRIDCPDDSDEAVCSILDIPQGYRTVIPPPPINDSQSLHVSFSIKVISFPTIATQDLRFTATLQLRLRWKDTRLNFHNLKKDRTLNLLSRESVEDIWTPLVFFSNALGNVFTNLELGSRVECVREGPSEPGPHHLPDEVNVFSGHENSLEMSQLYTASYSCDFDLIRFPFDSQVCRLRFALVSAAASFMVMDPHLATYIGPKYLVEYEIGDITMHRQEEDGGGESEFSTIEVEVRFIRRYTFYLLTLYIPTTFLIVIAYATFFFHPDDFNSRITVAITSLLVLTSLFTQTSNALPKTSYFKMIDVWLFFSIVVIFLVILLQTLINFSKPAPSATTTTHHNSWAARMASKLMYGQVRTSQRSPPVNSGADEGEETSFRRDPRLQENHAGLRYTNNDASSSSETRSNFPKSENIIYERASLRQRDKQEEDAQRQNVKTGQKGRESRPRAVFGSWFPPKNDQDGVNMSLMVKSRILIPVIFALFNICYWGIAFI